MNKIKVLNSVFVLFTIIVLNGCSQAPAEKESYERHIALDGQANFRDLGNYSTSDNKTIKTRLLYRSGTLSKLTNKDVVKLEALNIKTVVNFLTEQERDRYGNDILSDGIKVIYLPISGQNNETDALIQARENGNFSEIPVDFNYRAHGILVEDAKAQYAELFRTLANEDNYPIVFHCSHGIHRTGTAASILLSMLGIPWETVREDYLLSNEYRKDEIKKRVSELNQLASQNPNIHNQEKNLENIEAFYILRGEYVDGTKNMIEDNYGSFEDYLRDIGVTNKEIGDIKQILLAQ